VVILAASVFSAFFALAPDETVRPEVRLDVSAEFPTGTPGVVLVEAFSGDGASLGTREVRPAANGEVGIVPAETARVRVSSPLHETCEVFVEPASEIVSCSMEARARIHPFGDRAGRVWARRNEPGAPFLAIPPLAKEWGGGFAVPRGRIDLVLAPEGSTGSLLRLVDAASLAESRQPAKKRDPNRLKVRFVDASGAEVRDRPVVKVEPLFRPRKEEELELAAWTDFYERNGASMASGVLVLDPIPERREWVVFNVRFEGQPGVRLAAAGRLVDGVLDLGTIRLPRRTSFAVSIRSGLPNEEDPGPLTLDLSLVRPVPGLNPPARAPSLSRETRAGSAATFDQLIPGEYRLAVRTPDDTVGSFEVPVAEGDENRLDLELTREVVAGRVEDENGKEIVNALVGLMRTWTKGGSRHEVRTDAQGSFRLEFLHAGGSVNVWATPTADCATVAVELDPRGPDAAGILLRTRPGGVSVRVRDATTKEPIGDARLELDVALAAGPNWSKRGRTSLPDGVFSLCNLPAGSVRITATARGYDQADREVEIEADQLAEVELSLERAAQLRGKVLGSAGAPVPGARVFGPLGPFVGFEGEPPSVACGADGTFEMDLPAGPTPTLLAVVATGHRLALRWMRPSPEEQPIFLVAAGSDEVVELRYADGVPVRDAWIVLQKDGLLVPGAIFEEAVSAGGCVFEPSSRDGFQRFGGCVEPGTYALHARLFRPGGFAHLPLGAYQLPLPPGAELRSPLSEVP